MASHAKLVARRLAIVAGLLVGPGVVATAAPAQAAYVPSLATVAKYEARVIYQINVQRVKYAHGKLRAGTCHDKYAETWGSYLARTGSLYHQSMTPILRGCTATRASENLARGYTTADATVLAWMASPGHRANVLDGSLTRIGVAAAFANGRWTVVADFTRS